MYIFIFPFFVLLGNNGLYAQSYNEILGRPADSGMTISILSDLNIEVYWEYGTTSGIYDKSTPNFIADADSALEANFVGLHTDTKYYYRTRYRPAGTSGLFAAGPEHTFHTQRPAGSSYTFTIEADEHLYDKKGVRSLYKVCLANQGKDNPDFMFTLGDIFGNDHQPFTITSHQMDSLHKMYRPYLGSICHSVPLMICLGNHEGEKEYYLLQTPPQNMAVYGTHWRKFYYANPYPGNFYSGNPDVEPYGMDHPENYYSWTWGNALFVVLDVYRYACDTTPKPEGWAWTLGFPQYTWLKNTLENSTAQYKFVFAHHTRGEGRGGILTAPYFEWGGYEQNGTTWGFAAHRPGWEKPIHQLFKDNGVTIFFQGHDHLFAHEILDGVTYQEVPMPSDSTYHLGVIANGDAYVSDTLYGSGHLRVTVSPYCVKVDYVRAFLPIDTLNGAHHNGEVAFSYTVGDCSVGTDQRAVSPEITVFPNPASDLISVSLPPGLVQKEVRLINTMGITVIKSRSNTLDVKGIQSGLYFLSVSTDSFTLNKKVIISRY